MTKNKLRKILKYKRDAISENLRKIYSDLIYKNFLYFIKKFHKNPKNILIYNSFNSEVDTKKIIIFFFKKNFKVYLPAIINNNVYPIRFKAKDKLIKGRYGIFEPAKKIKLKNINLLDMVIAPGIGFDKNGNRIGFGKGYFDKFLSKLNKKIIKVGLAFTKQITKKIPAKKHDVKMDFLITEKEIINCQNNK